MALELREKFRRRASSPPVYGNLLAYKLGIHGDEIRISRAQLADALAELGVPRLRTDSRSKEWLPFVDLMRLVSAQRYGPERVTEMSREHPDAWWWYTMLALNSRGLRAHWRETATPEALQCLERAGVKL